MRSTVSISITRVIQAIDSNTAGRRSANPHRGARKPSDAMRRTLDAGEAGTSLPTPMPPDQWRNFRVDRMTALVSRCTPRQTRAAAGARHRSGGAGHARRLSDRLQDWKGWSRPVSSTRYARWRTRPKRRRSPKNRGRPRGGRLPAVWAGIGAYGCRHRRPSTIFRPRDVSVRMAYPVFVRSMVNPGRRHPTTSQSSDERPSRRRCGPTGSAEGTRQRDRWFSPGSTTSSSPATCGHHGVRILVRAIPENHRDYF